MVPVHNYRDKIKYLRQSLQQFNYNYEERLDELSPNSASDFRQSHVASDKSLPVNVVGDIHLVKSTVFGISNEDLDFDNAEMTRPAEKINPRLNEEPEGFQIKSDNLQTSSRLSISSSQVVDMSNIKISEGRNDEFAIEMVTDEEFETFYTIRFARQIYELMKSLQEISRLQQSTLDKCKFNSLQDLRSPHLCAICSNTAENIFHTTASCPVAYWKLFHQQWRMSENGNFYSMDPKNKSKFVGSSYPEMLAQIADQDAQISFDNLEYLGIHEEIMPSDGHENFYSIKKSNITAKKSVCSASYDRVGFEIIWQLFVDIIGRDTIEGKILMNKKLS
jgi:hypothetical protein